MRILLLLMVACGGAPIAPKPAPLPTAYAGRVGLTGGSWTDIVIEGTDPAARELCEQLVARERRDLSRLPATGIYTRACVLEPLDRPAVSQRYVLVDNQAVDQDTVLIDGLAAGRRTPLAPAHGHRIMHAPVKDRAACEALQARLDDEETRARAHAAGAEQDFVREQLERATEREQQACARLAEVEPRCATLSGEDAARCEVESRSARGDCERARSERAVLERHASVGVAPSASTRRCEQAR